MIKGNQKETGNNKYVGFTLVKLKAINPTRHEVNKILGREDSEDDKDLSYVSQDQEGNRRVRLSFWLHDEKRDKYFIHSFNLTERKRLSKDATKAQCVNNTCNTTWVPLDEHGNPDAQLLPAWFTHFTDRTGKETGAKQWRHALLGEEELVNLVRVWLGRIPWNDAKTSVLIDTEKLFNEDYSELRKEINGSFDKSFVILTGVRTDENDSSKQYQQVYSKSFLSGDYMAYIENGLKFPTDYNRRTWQKFEQEVTGAYGFQAYYELSPLKEYDPLKDLAVGTGPKESVTPTNPKF